MPGDDDRAATLWDRFADDVYAYARRRVGASSAPDVVAEVFTVVVADPMRVPDDALPWLYRTVWNTIMNLRRADARRAALARSAAARDAERRSRGGGLRTRRGARRPRRVVRHRSRSVVAHRVGRARRQAGRDRSGLLGCHVHGATPPSPQATRTRARATSCWRTRDDRRPRPGPRREPRSAERMVHHHRGRRDP